MRHLIQFIGQRGPWAQMGFLGIFFYIITDRDGPVQEIFTNVGR